MGGGAGLSLLFMLIASSGAASGQVKSAVHPP
jgi:hypothetical protein